VTTFGGFTGQLDDQLQLTDAVAYLATPKDGITAKRFRVKISNLDLGKQEGKVSAVVEGVMGALERYMYPEYKDIWDQNLIPGKPANLVEGRVKETKTLVSGCLPEIENCEKRPEAQRLDVYPTVSSQHFKVTVTLKLANLQPGATITGIVALSDD
jgi:hypothetical protein